MKRWHVIALALIPVFGGAASFVGGRLMSAPLACPHFVVRLL
jgi:hypothetical protein